MLYGNSCTNPIIYSVCNDQFRTAFKDLFGSCLRACCLFVKFARISKNRETAYSLRENRDARSPVHGNTFTAKEAETQKNYENIETKIFRRSLAIIKERQYYCHKVVNMKLCRWSRLCEGARNEKNESMHVYTIRKYLQDILF